MTYQHLMNHRSDVPVNSPGKNTAFARILSTREVRQALGSVLLDALAVVAGDSPFKKQIMNLVGRFILKNLKKPDDVFEKKELSLLFADETFIRDITETLPDIITGLFDIASSAAGTVENLGTKEKKELIGRLLSQPAADRTGELITHGCRIINDIHKDDPTFFTRLLAPGFEKLVASVDFGELKEMVENSGGDAKAFMEMANDVFWQYPAKVVLLLSMLPNIVNGIAAALDISLERLNELPPDLLTDVIISLTREIDAAHIAGLSNQVFELVRKVHTGSALLGEPGTPQLPKLIWEKLSDIVGGIDPITLWKARIAAAEIIASYNKAMIDAINENDALRQLSMIKAPEITNIRVRTTNQKLSHWENVDDEELAESMAGRFSAYDIQEMAETINHILRIFNRTGLQKPEMAVEMASQFADAIDAFELEEAAKQLLNGAGRKLRPLARSVLPGIVTWICDVLSPADDEYEDAAQKARNSLQSINMSAEV